MKPCKKCGSTDIELWDCGYSSFNPGGGRCRECKFEVKGEAGLFPTDRHLASIWDKGQKLTDTEIVDWLEKNLPRTMSDDESSLMICKVLIDYGPKLSPSLRSIVEYRNEKELEARRNEQENDK